MIGFLPSSGGEARPADLDHARHVQEQRAQGLILVRASATKWQAGLAGLIAIVTGWSVTIVRDQIATVQAPYPILLALLIGSSFLGAVLATLSALRASGGLPTIIGTSRTPDDLNHRDAVRAASDLRTAIRLTLGSLICLATAVCITWFAPTSHPQLARVTTPGGTHCGELDTTSIPSFILLTDKKEVTAVPLTGVTTWTLVRTC